MLVTSSRNRPWIDEGETATREPAYVSRRYTRACGKSCGRNQSIKALDRIAGPAPCQHDLGITRGGGRAKWEDAAGEVFGEHRLGGGSKRGAASSGRERGDAIQKLGLIDVSRAKVCTRLRCHPGDDSYVRLGTHQFRDHVGVENDHRSKFSGGPSVTGGCSGSSTPPNGAKRRWITSARLGALSSS